MVEWFWTFNTFNPLGYSYEQNPTFQFPMADGGTYPVQLQITDAQGCVNVVNREIVIQDMFNLFIPTSFTPNNDGTQRRVLCGRARTSIRIALNSRCGTVGENWCGAPQIPEDAWYGQVGEEGQHYVPNGPYSYRIEVHSLSEESYRKEVFGVVTIIR